MRNLLSFWRAEIARNPVAIVPLACLVASCAMNAHAGYALGNGSTLIVVIFLSIAMMTAYCGTIGLELPEWTFRKQALIGVFLIGIVVDQFSAWQTLGLQFADGQVARDTKATGLGSVKEGLERKRAELKALGRTRPIESIEAQAYLECQVVGPKCTTLRAELGNAKQATLLEKQIAALVPQLEGREQVAAGQVQFTVPIQIAQAALDWWYAPRKAPHVEGDHVSFVVMMVLAAVVCLLANMGFWLVGVGHDPQAPAAQRVVALLPPPSDGPGAAGVAEPLPKGPAPPAPAPWPPAWPQGGPPLPTDFALRGNPVSHPERFRLAPLPAPAAGGPAHGGGSNVSIVLNGVAHAPAGQTGPGQGPSAAPATVEVTDAETVDVAKPRRDLEGLSSQRPVDRSRVRRDLTDAERAAGDVILAFEAACLVPTPGAMVSAENLYRRYQAWAGERAIEPAAFVALFPELTGIELAPIGGQLHAHGLALRAGPALQSVEGAHAA